jgi:hypothetical protein
VSGRGLGTNPSRLDIFSCGNSFSFSFAFSLTILFLHAKNERVDGVLFIEGHEQRRLKDHRTVPYLQREGIRTAMKFQRIMFVLVIANLLMSAKTYSPPRPRPRPSKLS